MIDINRIRIPNNFVLILPDPTFKTYQFNGKETGIFVGNATVNNPYQDKKYAPDIDKFKHTSVKGKVIRVPEKLIFNGERIKKYKQDYGQGDKSAMEEVARMRRESVLYDVDMELREEDEVYFEYTAHRNAEEEGRLIETAEGDLLLIKYDLLLAKKEGEEVKPLNGWVFVEHLQYAREKAGSIKLVSLEEKEVADKRSQISQIVSFGTPCRGFLEESERSDDRRPLNKGEFCIHDPRRQRRLEWDYHRTIFGDKRLFRIHRKDMICVIPTDVQINTEELQNLIKHRHA